MRDFQKRFDRQSRFVSVFIKVVFALILCFWVFTGWVAYKAISTANSQDWSGGVKPVIEQLWCGKPGCLGAGK